ncbi:calmodulin-binding 60 A-like isoform X1 [Olea europaea subsp. europaea]|uniref:Calmodulin-binding 60 A-like isoform X1 n=1 Tax=Olea europaea subsp. europaea TaxID=158383 RepID=A0A8S0Q7M8_OLEEU|nr:calmodulin-binding 60 A-like isoform X1 [Olea europaea subsp. europaea]
MDQICQSKSEDLKRKTTAERIARSIPVDEEVKKARVATLGSVAKIDLTEEKKKKAREIKVLLYLIKSKLCSIGQSKSFGFDGDLSVYASNFYAPQAHTIYHRGVVGKTHGIMSQGACNYIFLHAISFPVFTGTQIEAEECNTLRIVLVDSVTGQVVSCGLECSATVKIVVLKGDFDGDERENSTLE